MSFDVNWDLGKKLQPQCLTCPWYDEGDFTPEGEKYCRGILEFGSCPYLFVYPKSERGLAD